MDMNTKAYKEMRRDPIGYFALRVIRLFAKLSVADARRRLRAAKFRDMFIKERYGNGKAGREKGRG